MHFFSVQISDDLFANMKLNKDFEFCEADIETSSGEVLESHKAGDSSFVDFLVKSFKQIFIVLDEMTPEEREELFNTANH